MTLRNNILLILVILSLLIFTGCNQPNSGESIEGPYPLVFTDDAGREVTISEKPTRIISFAPAHTETLFVLGLEEYIVGIDDYSNYPQGTQEIQSVGDAFTPNYELIVELQPDLVLTVGSSESPLVVRMDELGVTTVVLQATSLDDILEDISTIGRVCGVTEKASETVSHLQEKIQSVALKIEAIPEDERVKVFYEVSPPGVWGLWTIGPDSFIHDMIVVAGGLNISGDIAGDYFSYSEEVLIAQDPDVILTPNPETPEELSAGSRQTWKSISAVANGRVYLLDNDQVSRPGPRIVNALEDIAQSLYPDLF